MKNIIENIVSTNKSATRYLYKTHPDLWNVIVETTSFLPKDAKPKQRVWHILNEVYERPTCPITNKFVKWHENRYLETANVKAARIKQYQEGRVAIHNPEVKAKADESNRRTAAEGRRKKPTLTLDIIQQRVEKSKQTCIERYGVDNGSKTFKAREKIYNERVKQGCTPRERRSKRRLYYDKVWRYTEQSWKDHFDNINPSRLDRSKNALDHIYSIQQGFRDSIDPKIIGHWTNLQVIGLVENSTKGMRCDKSKQQLLEDYNKYTHEI